MLVQTKQVMCNEFSVFHDRLSTMLDRQEMDWWSVCFWTARWGLTPSIARGW